MVDYAMAHRGELFRHLARLLPRFVGTRHGRGIEPPSARQLFRGHQTIQFRELQPRGFHGDVPPVVQGTASGPHRLLLVALRGGGDGMGLLNARFFDNGMVDFLVKEREAGRIRNLGFSYHGDIRVFDYLLSRHDEFKWDFVQIQMNYLDWKFAKQINRATPTPNTSMANWPSGTFRPSSWNLCWEDGFPTCRTTSWRGSNSANRARAWRRGLFGLPEAIPAYSPC